MKKILASLLASSILLCSFSGCTNRGSFLDTPVIETENTDSSAMDENTELYYKTYAEIFIENQINDTPILFFTDENASFAREIISEEEEEAKKAKDSDKTEIPRYLVEKRTFGFDDDIVKDMEITFYLPTPKYDEKDMDKYGKEYEDFSFAEVDRKAGDSYHTVTITFVDLEYKENVAELTKKTDLVKTNKNLISMEKTKKHLISQHFSQKN